MVSALLVFAVALTILLLFAGAAGAALGPGELVLAIVVSGLAAIFTARARRRGTNR